MKYTITNSLLEDNPYGEGGIVIRYNFVDENNKQYIWMIYKNNERVKTALWEVNARKSTSVNVELLLDTSNIGKSIERIKILQMLK